TTGIRRETRTKPPPGKLPAGQRNSKRLSQSLPIITGVRGRGVTMRACGEDLLLRAPQLSMRDRQGGAPDEMDGDHQKVALDRMIRSRLQDPKARYPAEIAQQPDDNAVRPTRCDTRPARNQREECTGSDPITEMRRDRGL